MILLPAGLALELELYINHKISAFQSNGSLLKRHNESMGTGTHFKCPFAIENNKLAISSYSLLQNTLKFMCKMYKNKEGHMEFNNNFESQSVNK